MSRNTSPTKATSFDNDESTNEKPAEYPVPKEIGGSQTNIEFRGYDSKSRAANRGIVDLDDRSRARNDSYILQESSEILSLENPVSDERFALSVSIQHHSEKLSKTEVDIDGVWDADDPLDALVFACKALHQPLEHIELPMVSAHFKPAKKSVKEKLIASLPCCSPFKVHKYIPLNLHYTQKILGKLRGIRKSQRMHREFLRHQENLPITESKEEPPS